MGRLGNQMFQIASLLGMAKRWNRELYLPNYTYEKWWEGSIPVGERAPFDTEINEPHFHHDWKYWDEKVAASGEIANVGGWLQSYKYWKGAEEEVKAFFQFKEPFFGDTIEKYREIFENNRENIAISMRVGEDYKKNGNYEILPISYYVSALCETFPAWRNYNIVIFCDDMEYAKRNFEGENVYYAPAHPMEQLFLGTLCNHFIIANSTFSWWMAYLGAKSNSIVIRPSKYFKADLQKSTSLKDFWPEEWREWDYNKKVNMKDVTFTIPLTIEHSDRLANFHQNIAYLRRYLDTNILVGEQHTDRCADGEYNYMKFPYKEFHRTRMLNDMANEASTKIIVNQDVDVITPVFQLVQAAERIRAGADMVFPYDGRMARVERDPYFPIFVKELDPGYFQKEFKGTRSFDPLSVGGVIFWNKENFVFGGMENEYMVNYGPEDVERVYRMKTLGYKIERIKGITYHLDHWVGPNSGGAGNPHYGPNYDELHRIEAMNNEQLLNEIAKWPWVNQYMGAYYEEINEGSIKSAKAIFEVLKTWDRYELNKVVSVIDVGCGVGSWHLGMGAKYDYYGIDHKVPKHRLQFPESHYADYDLNSNTPFPFNRKFDLAICTEVAEHLPESSAEKLVKLLCSLSDRVLFSAAIPHQGGNGHLNEQWQPYWEKLFIQKGMKYTHSMVEDLFWKEEVELWYRQNCLYFKNSEPRGISHNYVVKYVHPQMYENIIGTLTEWK